jgi:hypothetical protein
LTLEDFPLGIFAVGVRLAHYFRAHIPVDIVDLQYSLLDMLSAVGQLLITENCAVTHENTETEPIQFDTFLLDAFDTEFSMRTTAEEWERALDMRNQPNFMPAILKYHAQLLGVTSGHRILNKLVAEVGRYEILAYLLYLYDSRDPANPRSGLTITNLEKMCTRQNCASPGRVRAIVGLMWAVGYLKRQQFTADSRIGHFEPTKKLMTVIDGWNHEIFVAIDEIFPDDGLAARHLSEPRFGWDMRKNGVNQIVTGWKPLDLFPEIFHFISRDAGWMLLIYCVGETMRLKTDDKIIPISVDLARFGARFSVSRSHLRRLLESAYDLGLLDALPRNGNHVVLSKKLIAAYFMSMAFELQFYRKHALGA